MMAKVRVDDSGKVTLVINKYNDGEYSELATVDYIPEPPSDLQENETFDHFYNASDNSVYTKKRLEVSEVVEPPKETLVEKITRLEQQVMQDNLVTFEVLATIYEELLASKGSV
jgi:hypothetical protein